MDAKQVSIDAAKLAVKYLVPEQRTLREQVAEIALKEVGTTENPAGSNNTKYGEWYKLNGVAWCAIFVSWVYNRAGITLPEINKGYQGLHYVPSGHNYWRKQNELTTEPKLGDIVLFEFGHDHLDDHIGIFIKWDVKGESFYSVEGNTSFDSSGSQANGGAVAYRKRYIKHVSGFASPKEINR